MREHSPIFIYYLVTDFVISWMISHW